MRSPRLRALLALPFLVAMQAPSNADAPSVQVPAVVGWELLRAERDLARLGLTVRRLGPAEGEGRAIVTGQSPAAGATVRTGAQVRLTYRFVPPGEAPPRDRDAPRTCPVPALVGLDPARAERVLQDAGFGTKLIGPTGGDSGRAIVVGQHPAAGAEAVRGSTVRVTWRWQR